MLGTNYIGKGLTINLPLNFTSATSYNFKLFGVDIQFATSTDETAKQVWTKAQSSVTYTTQVRDVPLYKNYDWSAKGY